MWEIQLEHWTLRIQEEAKKSDSLTFSLFWHNSDNPTYVTSVSKEELLDMFETLKGQKK